MRIALAAIATILVALGLWMISLGFLPSGPAVVSPGSQITTTTQTTAGPVALGTALLAGGGLLFIMLLRRR